MPGGVSARSPSLSWTPLALTLGLHLLLVLAWRWSSGLPPTGVATAEREAMLVMVSPPPRPAPAVVSRPAPRARPAPRVRPLVPIETATPAPSPEPEPIPLPAEVEVAPAPAPLPGALLAASRRMAGRIDSELRNGAGPITAEPERKWERFAGMAADARTNSGSGVSLDSHTASDGTTIYRKTVGNRVSCYRSGSVGGLGLADGRSAGNVACPKDVRWKRL